MVVLCINRAALAVVVECIEESIRSEGDNVQASTWRNPALPAACVIVFVHGLMMHGRVFEQLARCLTAFGVICVAPDLRGFGRWYYQEASRCSLDFETSLSDITKLLGLLKEIHPDCPLVIAGESFGAHVARAVAGQDYELLSGLILSNPCIRPRMMSLPLIPHTVSQIVQAGLLRRQEIDLRAFADVFLKDEQTNLKDYLEDPMSRKSLDILELIESMLIVGSYRPAEVPAHLPVLIFRGSNDGVCKSASYQQFVSTLKTDRMTIHRCTSCAHLILQSKSIDEQIVEAICKWLETL